MENNLETKVCSKCKEERPFPAEFMASYTTMKVSAECRTCRKLRNKNYRKNNMGRTEEKSKWIHSIDKFFKKSK